MSGRRHTITEGQGLVEEELDRWAGDSAAMDDRVTEILAMPGTVTDSANTKVVMPLAAETDAVNPRLLVVPAPTAGVMTLKPAWYGVSNIEGSSYSYSAPKMVLAHTQYEDVQSGQVPSNSSGATAYHALYVSIARAVSVTGSRLVRNSADEESTQSLNLADVTSITNTPNKLAIGNAQASRANALLQIPSDGSSSYSFFLGYVVVADGYTLGTRIYQNSTLGTTYIEQAWAGGGVQPHRATGRLLNFLSGSTSRVPSTGALLYPSGQTVHRFGGFTTWYGAFKQPVSDTNFTISLDTAINWKNRLLHIIFVRAASHSGTYPALESVTAGGQSVTKTLTFFTGTTGSSLESFTMTGAGAGAGNIVGSIGANASGNLALTWDTGATGPADSTNGDNWSLLIIASDRFSF